MATSQENIITASSVESEQIQTSSVNPEHIINNNNLASPVNPGQQKIRTLTMFKDLIKNTSWYQKHNMSYYDLDHMFHWTYALIGNEPYPATMFPAALSQYSYKLNKGEFKFQEKIHPLVFTMLFGKDDAAMKAPEAWCRQRFNNWKTKRIIVDDKRVTFIPQRTYKEEECDYFVATSDNTYVCANWRERCMCKVGCTVEHDYLQREKVQFCQYCGFYRVDRIAFLPGLNACYTYAKPWIFTHYLQFIVYALYFTMVLSLIGFGVGWSLWFAFMLFVCVSISAYSYYQQVKQNVKYALEHVIIVITVFSTSVGLIYLIHRYWKKKTRIAVEKQQKLDVNEHGKFDGLDKATKEFKIRQFKSYIEELEKDENDIEDEVESIFDQWTNVTVVSGFVDRCRVNFGRGDLVTKLIAVNSLLHFIVKTVGFEKLEKYLGSVKAYLKSKNYVQEHAGEDDFFKIDFMPDFTEFKTHLKRYKYLYSGILLALSVAMFVILKKKKKIDYHGKKISSKRAYAERNKYEVENETHYLDSKYSTAPIDFEYNKNANKKVTYSLEEKEKDTSLGNKANLIAALTAKNIEYKEDLSKIPYVEGGLELQALDNYANAWVKIRGLMIPTFIKGTPEQQMAYKKNINKIVNKAIGDKVAVHVMYRNQNNTTPHWKRIVDRHAANLVLEQTTKIPYILHSPLTEKEQKYADARERIFMNDSVQDVEDKVVKSVFDVESNGTIGVGCVVDKKFITAAHLVGKRDKLVVRNVQGKDCHLANPIVQDVPNDVLMYDAKTLCAPSVKMCTKDVVSYITPCYAYKRTSTGSVKKFGTASINSEGITHNIPLTYGDSGTPLFNIDNEFIGFHMGNAGNAMIGLSYHYFNIYDVKIDLHGQCGSSKSGDAEISS